MQSVKPSTPNRFLRVRNSEDLGELNPLTIRQKLQDKQYLFIDFNDPNGVAVLDHSQPADSDEEMYRIGGDYVAGLNHLSSDTYKLLQFLADGRVANEHKNQIDQIVRTRVRRLQQRRQAREEQASKTKRKQIKNYDIKGESLENVQEQQKNKLPDTYQKLQQYLEKTHNDMLMEKLKQGERELQKSMSSAADFKKLNKSSDLQSKSMRNSIQFKLPSIGQIKHAHRF